MTQVQISYVAGATFPIFIYACDVFGNNCVLVASVTSITPLPYIITLPPQFDTAPQITLKFVDAIGCEHSEILLCTLDEKVFEDGVTFLFMDGITFIFQDQ
ncbi:MAG: hypothetical protein EBZ92_05775 [Actinobacteria bacterium]|nr:hypothetical protein [Actinomycetota bacterium]